MVRRPAGVLTLLTTAAALSLGLTAVAWALGELSQKPGTAGCVSETGTGGACQNGKALEDALGVAASPDGKSVYVASFASDAVAVFDRDPGTGALSQKPGTAGCVSRRDGRRLPGRQRARRGHGRGGEQRLCERSSPASDKREE